ncbi:diaminopimelate decarboxylase [Streptosporangium becharense]|uniref:Diaminopimelate decarboxylase n=1 Tax=Streptosporangium becharense TaxID=1816182 RepID=A0A7W9ILJ1_9ACTN|nr:diaminopimelate decarboxylase [Streptosporangium becharense]MBB2910221.1 diaminopimelate decarboxylase [Streptosporangium becharense]MBB5822964.1 diaminopimelate decarboxylase [Streptosporangium becharense]
MSLVIENGWPRSAAWTGGERGELRLGGIGVRELAAEFGTPVYVLDEEEFLARCALWREALPDGEVHYGGKAFLCPEVVRWLDSAGLCLDVCTGGELAVAVAGGMDPARVVFHGNNKSAAELRRAVALGVGCVVVDSFTEIERLTTLAEEAGIRQRVMIRVTPGVSAHTHEFIATGGDDSKFGFSLNAGLAAEAVRRVLAAPALELAGLHSHIGSQITDLGGFALAARRMSAFLLDSEREHGVTIPKLDLGGGLGIVHRPGDPVPPSPAEVVAALREAVPARVRLAVEPGRSIAGPTTVALYEVGTVKDIPGVGRYVSVDGGMSDNPRPAMYGAAYTAVVASRASQAPPREATVVGRHCESGDVLVRDLPLPADVRPGDLLAVPASGAYQRSMASNYNHVTRPPVIAVRDGSARVIVRRETEDDLLRLYT